MNEERSCQKEILAFPQFKECRLKARKGCTLSGDFLPTAFRIKSKHLLSAKGPTWTSLSSRAGFIFPTGSLSCNHTGIPVSHPRGLDVSLPPPDRLPLAFFPLSPEAILSPLR